jgi:O-antigen/teichoic acid export membrane protein
MSIERQVIKGVKWTTISTIVLALTQILRISILTRFLDKADFGLMAMVTFVMSFMDLFNDMGLTSAILHKQNINKQEYASVYWLNLFVSFLMYLILLGITPLVATFYNQPRLETLIPLLGLNLLISGIGRQFKTIESKNLLFKPIAIIEMSAIGVSFVAAILLSINGWGVYALVYPALLQYIISNVILLIIGVRKYGLLFHFRFAEVKPFLRIGFYQVGGQMINYFNRDLDILLIGRFFSAEILGGYSLAKQLVFQPAQIINPILTRVASPALAKFQSNLELLKKNYLKLINIISTVNILVYFSVIVFAPWIIQIMYGNQFQNITILVRILSIYMIFRAIGNPVGSLVVATGRTDLEFIWNTITLIVMPIFIFIGANMGIVEVTIGITLAMVILFVPNWKLLINRMTGATLKEYCEAIFKIDFGLLTSLRATKAEEKPVSQ